MQDISYTYKIDEYLQTLLVFFPIIIYMDVGIMGWMGFAANYCSRMTELGRAVTGVELGGGGPVANVALVGRRRRW